MPILCRDDVRSSPAADEMILILNTDPPHACKEIDGIRHLLFFSLFFFFSWILLKGLVEILLRSAPENICSWKWKRKRVDCRSRITVLLHRTLYRFHIVCLKMSVCLEECVCVLPYKNVHDIEGEGMHRYRQTAFHLVVGKKNRIKK